MSNFNKSELSAAVALIREAFGAVDTPTLGVLLAEHFPDSYKEWEQQATLMSVGAESALMEWRAHAIRRSLIATFARPGG